VEGTLRELAFAGIEPDRPVGLQLDHDPASALLLVALLEAGIPTIPLPPFFTATQRVAALEHAGAVRLIDRCWLEQGAIHVGGHAIGSAPAELPTGTAVISFSSGSTGAPKGVCLSAEHLVGVARNVCEFLGRDLAGRHLPVLPFGILLEQVAGLFASIIAGGTYVALPGRAIGLADPLRPEPGALLKAIDDQRATSLILVPEYLALLVGAMEASGIRLPQLNLVAVGGARTPEALLDRARALGLPVRQGYGMTEAGSVIALEDGQGPSTGAVGRSIGAHVILLVEDGEIVIDGPMHLGLVGEHRTPGPFATGDLGRFDAQGNLRIVGRKSNLIVTSLGRNISPEWVEGLLTAEPEIAQAMVRSDGSAGLEALIVPAGPNADVAAALFRANASLPAYGRLGAHRLVPPFTPMNGQLTGNGRLRRLSIDQAYPKESDVTEFFDRLVADTREEQARFAMTPQLIAGLTGRISRADYIAYLTEAYHHVRHTVPLMQEARAGLVARGDAKLVAALDDYIEEETGHEEWILNDIAAAGGDREAAAASAPSDATKAMVDHAYHTIRTGNPAGFFGMVFVLEGTSIAMASNGASAVQRNLGLPKSAFTYLNSHGALDQEHMVFFAKLMNEIDDPADQAAIIQMARDMFRLFGGLFAAIELEDTRNAA
jgi:acyl-CoA synthetase (AMP-forming)/AMP-acid ligase II/pyrroloquinoline quinone (PQQ) biosynthesis protein C